MSFYGRLQPDNELLDIGIREPTYEDDVLIEGVPPSPMPGVKLYYDSQTHTAIPMAKPADDRDLLVNALTIKLSPQWDSLSAEEQAKQNAIIEAHATDLILNQVFAVNQVNEVSQLIHEFDKTVPADTSQDGPPL